MRPGEIAKDPQLKHYALQIVAQLPQNKEEALRVLDHARELVDWAMVAADPAQVLQLIS